MNAWSCEDCDLFPSEHAARGHCEGPFTAELRRSEVDERGRRYVEGGVIVPIAHGPLRGAHFSRCPLPEALGGEGVVSAALTLWRHSNGGQAPQAVFKRPSIAALEALEVIGGELDRIEERRRELEAD